MAGSLPPAWSVVRPAWPTSLHRPWCVLVLWSCRVAWEIPEEIVEVGLLQVCVWWTQNYVECTKIIPSKHKQYTHFKYKLCTIHFICTRIKHFVHTHCIATGNVGWNQLRIGYLKPPQQWSDKLTPLLFVNLRYSCTQKPHKVKGLLHIT